MKMTEICFKTGLVMLISMLCLHCSESSIEQKPNIVLILADDLGWNQIGCYGSDYYKTPNIDKLAKEGMRFTDAYAAAPVCSPTRASIMTGKYPARLHLTDYIRGTRQPENSPLLLPQWTPYLKLEEITIAEALKEEGYATASFGKWHLSKEKLPPKSESHNPDKQGFDESFVTYKPAKSLAREWQTPENDGHNVQIITEKSLDFIERHKDESFFLYVTHNTIHRPLMEKESVINKYKSNKNSDLPENNATIAAMIETLDISVGKILEKLEELNLKRKTLVIFFSDNGGLANLADQTPLRAGKGAIYEGGIREPLIARWPGKIPAGSTDETPVSSVDLFPTLLNSAGSNKDYQNIDGMSLIPLLTKSGKLDRDAIFFHYPHHHKNGVGPSGAIRMGDYKLIEWFEKSINGPDTEGALELFNLRDDMSEKNNLVIERKDLTKKLYNKLKTWRQEVGAQDMLLKK